MARERGGAIERLKPHGGYGDPNVVFHLYEDPQGNVRFSQSGDLYQATAAGRLLIASDVNAQYLASDRDGDLWLGTRTRGLFRLKSQAVKMFTAADGLPSGKSMAVLAASDGKLWVANYCGGLSKHTWTRMPSTPVCFPLPKIATMTFCSAYTAVAFPVSGMDTSLRFQHRTG